MIENLEKALAQALAYKEKYVMLLIVIIVAKRQCSLRYFDLEVHGSHSKEEQ
jgi:hypothetical protein